MSMLPGAALEGLLGAFSRDGRHLALVSPDGRISVHDAREYVAYRAHD